MSFTKITWFWTEKDAIEAAPALGGCWAYSPCVLFSGTERAQALKPYAVGTREALESYIFQHSDIHEVKS